MHLQFFRIHVQKQCLARAIERSDFIVDRDALTVIRLVSACRSVRRKVENEIESSGGEEEECSSNPTAILVFLLHQTVERKLQGNENENEREKERVGHSFNAFMAVRVIPHSIPFSLALFISHHNQTHIVLVFYYHRERERGSLAYIYIYKYVCECTCSFIIITIG